MRPLSILHVVPYYEDAWAYGGIPRLAGAMTRGLARRGHHVTVCTTDAAEPRKFFYVLAGSTLAPASARRGPGGGHVRAPFLTDPGAEPEQRGLG